MTTDQQYLLDHPTTFSSLSASQLLNGIQPITLPTLSIPNAPIVPTITPTGVDPNMQGILDSYVGPSDPSKDPNNPENNPDLLAKRQNVQNLTNQLNGINTNATVAQQTLSSQSAGKDVTTQFLGAQQQEISRQAAIQGLPVAASLAAAQGDLNTAQTHLDNLFKYQQDYAKAQMDFTNKKIDAVYNIATKSQQDALDAKKAQLLATQKVQDDARNNAQAIVSTLLKTQPQLAAQISGIDWSQPDAGQKYQDLLSQAKQDPTVALDIALKQADLAYKQKQTQLLGAQTAAQQKADVAALKQAETAIPILQDKVALIDALKTSPGMNDRVGTSLITRKPSNWWESGGLSSLLSAPAELSGQGQNFAESIHQLASKEFIDTLINSKQQGATYGALSDNEGNALRVAATKINGWEIKNKGAGTGVWNIDQADFIKELDTIKKLANRTISNLQGSTLSTEEQSLLDSAFQNQDASNYYNQ